MKIETPWILVKKNSNFSVLKTKQNVVALLHLERFYFSTNIPSVFFFQLGYENSGVFQVSFCPY